VRWDAILERLSQDGAVEVGDVAAALGVSASTIRRDLTELEARGALSRTHGGAVSSGVLYELPLRYRGEQRRAEKQRIAAAAARHVHDGVAVGLTGGTTTTLVARAIASVRGLTIVTNALNIASELAVRASIKLVVTGGVVRSASYELAGPLAEQTLRSLHLDLVFCGVDGISRAGLTTHDEAEAHTNRTLIGRAQRTVVVADSTKLGRVHFGVICPLEDVDELITDADADPDAVIEMRDAGLAVTVV
jgi:DeoR family transcriptional regulator, aga operon transcriptional repressor